MNIAFVISQLFEPSQGGVQMVTQRLCEIFSSFGDKVVVISLTSGENINISGVSVKYLGINKIRSQYNQELSDLLKKEKIDCIINQMGFSTRITGLLMKSKQNHVKVVNNLHINPLNFVQNSDTFLRGFLQQRKLGFLHNKLLLYPLRWYHRVKQYLNHQYILNRVDAYIMLNSSFIPELSYFWIDTEKYSDKLFAIPNPFQEPDYPIELEKKENVIMFVGRLNKTQKRVDLLMEIWRKLHSQLPDWQFWVVGDGPERKWMEKYCRYQGMDRVQFFGYDTPDAYYRKAKILHFTSAYEGFGNVLVEAQQNGVVPILFDSYSAASEIVWDDRNGVLIEPFDVAEYCSQTLALINNNAKLKKLASNAVEDVKRYNYEAVGKKWLKLFSETTAL